MSLELALTVGGILLTVVTFLIGYRRTIGALNERTKVANDALIISLEKHLSLSDVAVTDRNIESFRAGQAYLSGVDIDRIIPRNLLRDIVATRIFQNEYLSFEEKDRSLKALGKSFDYQEAPSKQDLAKNGKGRLSRAISAIYEGISSPTIMLGFISALISSLAALVVAGLNLNGVSLSELRGMAVPLGIAILGTAAILVSSAELKRRSSRQPEPTPEPLSEQRKLFSEVYDILFKIEGVEIPIEEVDFHFSGKSGKKIGVEVRAHSISITKDFIERLEHGIKKFNLDKIIVIGYPEVIKLLNNQDKPSWLNVMDLEELISFVTLETDG